MLSLPFALRYRLAYDAGLTSALLGVFVRAVFASLRRRARRHWSVERGQCGAVTFVQRFGDALNQNLHFHSLVLDGVYETSPYGRPRFHPLPPPDDAEVARVVGQVAVRIGRLLQRRGLGPEANFSDADPLSEEEPLLAQLYGASVTSRIATGRRAGQPVIRIGDCVDPDAVPELDGQRCASASGVSLHANVVVAARDRQLERLCRYVARPPVATERLSRMADGRLLYRLTNRWRDGTTHVVFEPGELVEKLAAPVPPPRFHLVRYHVRAPKRGHSSTSIANTLRSSSAQARRRGRSGNSSVGAGRSGASSPPGANRSTSPAPDRLLPRRGLEPGAGFPHAAIARAGATLRSALCAPYYEAGPRRRVCRLAGRLRPGDHAPALARAWAEEPFDVFQHLVGCYGYRIWFGTRAQLHYLGYIRRFAACIARGLGREISRGSSDLQRRTLRRYLKTFTPWYDPSRIALPAGVNELLARYSARALETSTARPAPQEA